MSSHGEHRPGPAVEYHPWLDDEEDDALAWIEDEPDELGGDAYRLFEGKPAGGWFPRDLVFQLSKTSGVRVGDAIPNVLSLLCVSEKLRDLLQKELAPHAIEFLPVRIRNQKKKLVAGAYYVANVLDAVACMDPQKSRFRMNPILKDQVQSFSRLVLDEARIPQGAKLFRLREEMRLVIIRSDLAAAISSAFTGMSFPTMEDYGREFRSRAERS